MINTAELAILQAGYDKIKATLSDQLIQRYADILRGAPNQSLSDYQLTVCLALLANMDDKPKVVVPEYVVLRGKLLGMRSPNYIDQILDSRFWLEQYW